MRKFLLILVISPYLHANSLKLTDFTKDIAQCLKTKNIKCLEKHITRELIFPEHETFGCETERPGKITPYEFALCAIKSKVKCTDKKVKIPQMTLYAVLLDCFTNPISVGTESQIVTKNGYVCRLEDVNHELFLSSVAVQDHLSGFEENVDSEDQKVKKVKNFKPDF